MIELSEEAKRLTSTFLAYRNDVDIYTEDNEKDKEFYKVLFSRLIKKEILINDITPLGSKNDVLKRCQEEPENGRKKIFIIDGDVTIIHGKDIPSLKNLFVLDAYCIENFLINKETVIHFIYLNCGTKAKETIDTEVAFEEWLSIYCEKLISLFLHFALIDFFGGIFSIDNANKYHIKNEQGLEFSEEKINAEILELKGQILTLVDEQVYEEKHNELKQKWSTCLATLLTIVSGKDYLIPIVLLKTQTFKKSRALPSLEEVKLSLAHYSNLDRLAKLKETIESL